MAGTRPGGVTLVAVIGIITGILQALTGLLALFAGGGAAAAGIIALIIGIFTIIVSVYLLRGSRLARVLVTISFVLSLASAVYAIIVTPSNPWSAIVSGLLALIGIILLYTRRANDYFGS
jgi:hypothetical protein